MARKQNQVIVEFIELYRSVPCLWQVKSEEYHDRTKKDAAYSKLVKKLEELEPGATKNSVRMKINSLRCAYRKEKKKVEASKKSGASTDSIYKPVLWYYDMLEFLQDQDTLMTSRSNVDNENEEKFGDNPLPVEEINSDAEDSTMSTSASTMADVQEVSQTQLKQPINSRPGSNKRNKRNDDLTEVLTKMLDYFKRPKEQPDRYDLIGSTIALRLKALDKRVALVAEKKINDILFEAEMGYLSTSLTCHYASPTSQSTISPAPSSSTYEQGHEKEEKTQEAEDMSTAATLKEPKTEPETETEPQSALQSEPNPFIKTECEDSAKQSHEDTPLKELTEVYVVVKEEIEVKEEPLEVKQEAEESETSTRQGEKRPLAPSQVPDIPSEIFKKQRHDVKKRIEDEPGDDKQSMFDHLYDLDRIHQRAPRRILSDRMNPFDFLTEGEFLGQYRLNKEAMINIIERVAAELPETESNRGLPIPHHLQVLIAVRYMATGSFQLTISDCLEISQPAVSRCISRVSSAIAMLAHQVIKMPALNESLQVMEEFQVIGNMPGIIGCIDCTHVRIKRPPGDDSERYRNRKGKFSINTQAVCGPRLQFFNLVARWPGSSHDSNIFHRSRLCVQMEDGQHRGILLGDAGYGCETFMFTPLRNPQSDQERRYNRAHIKTRNTIERAFGVWKRRFACLAETMHISVGNTMSVIVAAAVLHNIAIEQRVPLPDEDAGNNDNEDIEDDAEPAVRGGMAGNVARQRYIRDYF